MDKLPNELINKIKLYVGNPMIIYDVKAGSNICNQAMKITMGLYSSRRHSMRYNENVPCVCKNVGEWFHYWLENKNFPYFVDNV